jgi:hypothetical protein
VGSDGRPRAGTAPSESETRGRHGAHSAAQAVLTAAARAGVSPTPDVTAVARSAADAARLLTAEGLVSAELAQRLSNDWNDLLVQPLDRQTAVPVTSETRRV